MNKFWKLLQNTMRKLLQNTMRNSMKMKSMLKSILTFLVLFTYFIYRGNKNTEWENL